jgi:hypothetical protein
VRWHDASRVLGGLSLLSLLMTAEAKATLGGPDTAEVLGVVTGQGRVYFQIVGHNESGAPPEIWSFDLRGRTAWLPIREEWSVEAGTSGGFQRDYRRRLATLRARLTPLRPLRSDAISFHYVSVRSDTMVSIHDTLARFLLSGRLTWEGTSAPVMIRCYNTARADLIRGFEVPGEHRAIAIVSFIGIPWEGGYVLQVPVLLGEASAPRRWLSFTRR